MTEHRCNDNGCPYLGQASPKSCACHKTNEQVLREQVCDLMDAAERALNYIANTESELGITLDSGDMLRAAIAKATGGAA